MWNTNLIFVLKVFKVFFFQKWEEIKKRNALSMFEFCIFSLFLSIFISTSNSPFQHAIVFPFLVKRRKMKQQHFPPKKRGIFSRQIWQILRMGPHTAACIVGRFGQTVLTQAYSKHPQAVSCVRSCRGSHWMGTKFTVSMLRNAVFETKKIFENSGTKKFGL